MTKPKLLLLVVFLCCSSIIWAQSIVTGKITDSKTGAGISNVSIIIKGTTQGTYTNSDGAFRLEVPKSNSSLMITSLGYSSKEVAVSGATLNITLEPGNSKNLDEIVVVGYGTKIKKDIVSSISRVTSKDFNNQPLPSFEEALQGRASGVYINSGSGKLGQALNVRVRGISSISADQQPFVVVDGVPIVSQALGSSDEPDNPLATINPDDIESIEVLKDAASSAIYGSRASNGVILVTTKSGKQGKSRVSAGFYTGWSKPTRYRKFLNAAQYREIFDTAALHYRDSDLDPTSEDPLVGADEFESETGTNDWNSTNDVNWGKLAFQHGAVQQYNASLSGGDARTKFLISASYNDQKGIIVSNRLTRGTGRINIDHTINSIFKIGTNISLTQSNNYRVPSDNAFSNPLQLNAIPPIQPEFGPDGKLNTATIYYNALIDYEDNNKNLSKTARTISNAYIEATINPNLKFRSQVGIDWNNLQESQFLGRRTLDGAPNGYSYSNQVTASVFTNTNTLNFNKAFNSNNTLDALAGIEYQRGETNGSGVTGLAFPSDRFTKIASAAIISAGTSSETSFRFLSYFIRGNYKLNNRYLVGASFRVDGSSRFSTANRYGIFPAVSAGWVMSEENFLKNSNVVSFLKLRSSYGVTGNAEIGNFSYRSLYTAAAYSSVSGIITSQIGDDKLKWENTKQFDIGLDFGFLKNRISGEVDVFSKKTKDLLLDIPVPATNGFSTITKNIGDMNNKGIEVTLNGNILVGLFKWNVSINVSTYKNEVTRLVAPVPPGGRTLGRLAVGAPFGQFYGVKFLGADPANGDALFADKDGKPTNDYSLAVERVIGDPNPDYYGGFNNHFSYKAFDLDVQCQFVKGGDIYNIAGIFQSNNANYFDNQTLDQMNFWRKPGDVTMVPQPRLYTSNGDQKSSRWVQDGSYLRVKSVNLGYNIPKSILRQVKMESLRIYVAASNLFTFTKYTGYDPEVNTQYVGNINLGHDFYTPPQARTITVGVNVGL
ncbi:MAG: TonB-dependent receptor [Bacteroidetes bacterium]|nr:TonB-dependent receptor [Bacteroidota bacterium]MBS1756376.1 TonB-dependent receptor [Bacteroidota bacterium]